MDERRKAEAGAFPEQEITFYSELPPRGGVLEYEDVLEDVGRAARLDRADKALNCLVAGIVILTSQHGERLAGVTIGTLATASQRPPRVSVAIRRDHPACELLLSSGTFAVNFLSEAQRDVCDRFSAAMEDSSRVFDKVEYSRGVSSGAPILQRALGFVECKVAETVENGDHMVILGDVLDGGSLTEGTPLITFGAYKPTSDISDNLSVGS